MECLLSEGTLIEDKKTHIKYKLCGTTALNFGTYSIIWMVAPSSDYLSVQSSSSESEVGVMESAVAKIGRFRIDEHVEDSEVGAEIEKLEPLFNKEFEFVQKLREKSDQRFAPMIHQAQLLEGSGQKIPDHVQGVWNKIPVLLMEYVKKEWLLSKQLESEPGRPMPERERLAVEAGFQYAELLSIMHSELRVVCGDRKVDDFYWNPQEKKLYVLDWNVYDKLDDTGGLNDDSTEKSSSTRPRVRKIGPRTGLRAPFFRRAKDDLIKRDIRLFGQIWLQFLAHRDLEELPVDNPATGTPWDQLSRGTRRLLRSTLKNDKGFEHAEGVKKAWKEWAGCLGKSRTALLQEANLLMNEEGSGGTEYFLQGVDQGERVRDLIDLVTLLGDEDISEPDYESLATAKKWLEESDSQFSSMIALYKTSLEEGHFGGTRKKLDELRCNDAIPREQQLRASRLYLVASVLYEESQQAHTVSEELRSNILKADTEFSKKNFADVKDILDKLEESHAKDAALQVLKADAQFNTSLSNAETSYDPKLKQDDYQTAQRALSDIIVNDEYHANILQAITPVSLQNKIDKLEQEIRQEEEKKHVRKTEEAINRKLSKAAEAVPPSWPLSVTEKPLTKLPEQSALKRPLIQITRGLQHGMDSRALERILEVASAVESGHSSIAQALRKLGGKLALYELEKRKKQAYCECNIQDALQFVGWLQKHQENLFDHMSSGDEIQNSKTTLEEALKCVRDIRSSLDNLKGLWDEPLSTDMVDKLKGAQNKYIRLVSTKWGEISISSLLLENGVRESEQRVEDIRTRLDKLDYKAKNLLPPSSESTRLSGESEQENRRIIDGQTSLPPQVPPPASESHPMQEEKFQQMVSQQMKSLLPRQLRQYNKKGLEEKLDTMVKQLKEKQINALSLERTLDDVEQFIGRRPDKSQEEDASTLSGLLKGGFDNLMSVPNVMEEHPILAIWLGLLHYKTQRRPQERSDLTNNRAIGEHHTQ